MAKNDNDQASNMIVEAVAAALADAIAVLPVREDGSKRPDLASWAQYQETAPTREELRGWYSGRERTGVGWITGAISGNLECLDFDSNRTFGEFRELAEAVGCEPAIRVLDGYSERTPHGAHLFFRSPHASGNLKLARDLTGSTTIETRGQGGYVIVAPSFGGVHPSGEPYTADVPFKAGMVALLTEAEREIVLSLARALDACPRTIVDAAPHQNGVASTMVRDRPGDIYAQRTSWADVLAPYGWRVVYRRGGEEYWSRPGARTGGVDATTNYAGSDLLYVFSTSGAPFDPERGYSRFGAYALLAHNGDYRAAAIDLAAQGYTANVEVAPLVASSARAVVAPEPPTPQRTPSLRTPAYRFVHGWQQGSFVARYIAYASARTDAAHEYHEAAALALLAACTPNVRTYLDPWPDGLNTALYLILLGGTTTSRKSTCLSLARRIMMQVHPAAVLSERMTPEAMVEQLAGRSRQGSLLVGDEFGEALESILRRDSYMSGTRELLLSLYGSRRYKYARRSKRGADGALRADVDEIIDPHMVLLTAATGAIFDALSSRDVQTGLLPRFGIVYPESMPERRPIYARSDTLDADEAWIVAYLQRLYLWSAISIQRQEDIRAEWSGEALTTIDDAARLIEESSNEILQRLGPMAIKIAMLASLGDTVPVVQSLQVDARDAAQGVRVMLRLQESALRFEDEIGGLSADQRKTEQAIERVLKLIRKSDGAVSRNTISRALKTSAQYVTMIEATMRDRGMIRVFQQQGELGRPTQMWCLA